MAVARAAAGSVATVVALAAVAGTPPVSAGGTAVLVSRSAADPSRAAAGTTQVGSSVSEDGRFVLFRSDATDLVAGQSDANGGTDIFLADRLAGTVTLVSRAAGSATTAADAPSGDFPLMTPDGSWVLFTSTATDLVAGQVDGNGAPDVFLFERATGAVVLVSRAATGATTTGDGGSFTGFRRSMSDDGALVAFASDSTNLVPGQVDPVPASTDLFLFERATGTVTLVSHRDGEPAAAASAASAGELTPDGAFVTFDSTAPDLVAGQVDANRASDVFRHEVATGTTRLVSHRSGSPGTTANGASFAPTTSAGAGLVAFMSSATDLVAGQTDTNGLPDVFLYEMASATTALVSHRPGLPGATGNDRSYSPVISGDGSTVAFGSTATDLSPPPGPGPARLYVFDRATGGLTLASHAAGDPAAAADGPAGLAPARRAISADGAYVLFESSATNLVAGQSGPPVRNVFLYDRAAGTSALASHTPAGGGTGGGSASSAGDLTANGRFASFSSFATDLVAGVADRNGAEDVFVFEREGSAPTPPSTGPGATSTTAPTTTPTTAPPATSTTVTSAPPSTVPPAVPVPGNLLDPDSATAEGTGGRWVRWFSSELSRSGARSRTGTHSFEVDVTAPFGWGITLDRFPGVPASPGTHVFSFWALGPAVQDGAATMTVTWRDGAGTALSTDAATVATGALWQQGGGIAVAPPGTVYASVDFTHAGGMPGDEIFLDDIAVVPATNALDPDTSTLEGSLGLWYPWFSAGAERSAEAAHRGGHGLRVEVTAPFGWGVAVGAHPGVATGPGPKALAFWGRSGSPGLSATLTASWRDAGGGLLGEDSVTTDLTAAWAPAVANVVAPPGTAYVSVAISHASGGPGDVLHFDDVAVVDGAVPVPAAPAAVTNLLDPATSTLEGSSGRWAPWFSAAVARSADSAHGGGASLRVDVTAPHGWGVTVDNHPGFPAGPGPHAIGFWGRSPSPGLAATLTVTWRDGAGGVVRADAVTLPLGEEWAPARAVVVAPPATEFVTVDLSNPAGAPGGTVFVDDVVVAPAADALDPDTAGLEGSAGRWVPWFSSEASRSEGEARSGRASLRVQVTARHGWGVTVDNHPGFPAAPGRHIVGFWARSPSPGLAAILTVTWRDASGGVLGADTVVLPLGDGWAPAAAEVVAPPGTARVTAEVTGTAGVPGDVLFLDDFAVLRPGP